MEEREIHYLKTAQEIALEKVKHTMLEENILFQPQSDEQEIELSQGSMKNKSLKSSLEKELQTIEQDRNTQVLKSAFDRSVQKIEGVRHSMWYRFDKKIYYRFDIKDNEGSKFYSYIKLKEYNDTLDIAGEKGCEFPKWTKNIPENQIGNVPVTTTVIFGYNFWFVLDIRRSFGGCFEIEYSAENKNVKFSFDKDNSVFDIAENDLSEFNLCLDKHIETKINQARHSSSTPPGYLQSGGTYGNDGT